MPYVRAYATLGSSAVSGLGRNTSTPAGAELAMATALPVNALTAAHHSAASLAMAPVRSSAGRSPTATPDIWKPSRSRYVERRASCSSSGSSSRSSSAGPSSCRFPHLPPCVSPSFACLSRRSRWRRGQRAAARRFREIGTTPAGRSADGGLWRSRPANPIRVAGCQAEAAAAVVLVKSSTVERPYRPGQMACSWPTATGSALFHLRALICLYRLRACWSSVRPS